MYINICFLRKIKIILIINCDKNTIKCNILVCMPFFNLIQFGSHKMWWACFPSFFCNFSWFVFSFAKIAHKSNLASIVCSSMAIQYCTALPSSYVVCSSSHAKWGLNRTYSLSRKIGPEILSHFIHLPVLYWKLSSFFFLWMPGSICQIALL